MAICPPVCWASIVVFGVTTVLPCENGLGCETCGFSLTRTDSVPWVTATVEICTSCPMTTVPVRESMTTRAAVSGSTGNSPISAMKRANADSARPEELDGPVVDLESRARRKRRCE